ncbi:MAG: hypothetical protein WDZ49_11205 [Litorilinea sp.]
MPNTRAHIRHRHAYARLLPLLLILLLAGCTASPEQWLIPTPTIPTPTAESTEESTVESIPQDATDPERAPDSDAEAAPEPDAEPSAEPDIEPQRDSQIDSVPAGEGRPPGRRDETAQASPPQSATATPSATPAPSVTDAGSLSAIHPDLAIALGLAPLTTPHFEYTNWALLKAQAGVPDLNSATDMAERMAFMMNVGGTEQAVATGFGRSHFRTHAEVWGWDSTDLQWEASFATPGGPLAFVLRFDADFDIAPVLAHFEEREFERTEHAFGDSTAILYSHSLDLRAVWMNTTEFAILNTAYLPDAHTLILASDGDALLATLAQLAAGETLATRPDIQSVAVSLGAAGAAMILTEGCPALDVATYMMEIEDMDTLHATLEELLATSAGGLYSVLGIGYRVEETGDAAAENSAEENGGAGIPVGIFVHHYPSAEQAYADLESRRAIAETGLSRVYDGVPYAELFSVYDATVREEITGANLNLILAAQERPPQLFFNMVLQRDLMFSTCGP